MKSVKLNFFWQAAAEILRVILPIATSPYLARTLGSAGVGVFAYAQSVVFTFKTCMDLGVHSFGRRSVARVRDSQAALNECFSSIFTLHFLISLIGTTAYLCYSFCFAEHRAVALVMGIWVAESLFSVSWLYVGMERVKDTAVCFLITKFISFFLIFIFVKGNSALDRYALIISLSVLMAELTLWPRLRSMVRFVRPPLQNILSYLPGSLALFVPTLLETVCHTMDKIMLGVMSGASEVGYYDYAAKSLILRNILTALGAALLPRISYLYAKRNYREMWSYIDRSLRLTIAFSVALSFGVAAVASDFAVLFWGEAFAPCANIMFVLSLSTPFWGVAQVIRTQYLIPTNRDREFIASILLGAVVNLLLNCLLIPRWNAAGAAIATLITEAVICLFQCFAVRGEFLTEIPILSHWPYLLFGLAMFGGVSLVKTVLPTTWIALFLEIAAGAVIYGISCLIYWLIIKDAFFLDNIKKAVGKMPFFLMLQS